MLSTLKSSLKVSLISLILIFSLIDVSHAHDNPGYYHGGGAIASNPRWMTNLKDDVLLSELSIPGTHDTMSFYGGDAVKTQGMSLSNQLQSGIRVLDIRCRNVHNHFRIYHGPVFQRALFEDVLDTVVDFLNRNPGETVLMRVKEENTYVAPTNRFEVVFDRVYWRKAKYRDYWWQGTSMNPRLAAMRGKIVVLQDFDRANQRFGMPYNSFSIQDVYHLRTIRDLYNKWTKVKDYLALADTGGKDAVKYMNYLSGSGGALPYFVASGHRLPPTDAARLATGETTITYPRGWPDFPRVLCAWVPIFGRTCTIAYEGTNILTFGALGTYYKNRVGTIMSDFPGAGLINRTIALNNRFRK